MKIARETSVLKIIAFAVGAVCALFVAPHASSAQVATTSPHQIGFYCPPYEESFAEGGYYEIATTTGYCFWQTGNLAPYDPHYGGLFRGTVGNSTGGGNYMAFSSQAVLNRPFPLEDLQEGESFFAAIWEVRAGPAYASDLQLFLNFFQDGSNPPPSNGWGIINWKWGEPPPDSLDPVIIIPGILGSEQHNGEWIIDPILHTYDDLIATLDVNGYTPEVDLFTFPYNWRQSNVQTALLLKEKIDQVKVVCSCDKVDLVAHSMGGLAARYYIQSDEYEDDVDQLIFLGTPHLGAPKAYLMWEGGTTGFNWEDEVLNFILSLEAHEEGYSDLFSYVRTEPIEAVRELLPTYDYIFDGNQLQHYPTGYPANPFLESLNSDVDKLLNSGLEIYNFVGDLGTDDTAISIAITDPSQYLPKWQHGFPELIFGKGDDTVATSSASFVDINLVTKVSGHRMLPTVAEGDVFEILTNESPSILVNNLDIVNLKFLLIKILSPADLLIIAPDGKKIGKDPQTNLEVNEIPNAFYTGFTTNTEYITILNPLEGEYKILNQGTGNGSYTVQTAYIEENQVFESAFTGNTESGLITELQVSVNHENPGGMEITPADALPPQIDIISPESRDYLHSEYIQVNVSPTDEGSGVYGLEILFGTTTIPNMSSVDLFFKKLGSHTLTASSTDNVGNAATSTRTFRIIATVDSTLSDIERAYSLGWMPKKIRDEIVKKFNAMIKISKIVEKKTDGKPKGEKVQKIVDKILARAMLLELQKLRGKGLNDQAYQVLKDDIQWLISN